ncbi:hypothetical protein GUJ93_ZPchr0012g21798 [Zizania palustris]|uniref:Uncharacterized protein n=1 Tax=Zizania palustris TaxID=103762 RepID=A0A8J5WUG7_ZIZPA|nr:hypothetical protein GUJ93_ZPchr0012g21798 [Zizania palustris]
MSFFLLPWLPSRAWTPCKFLLGFPPFAAVWQRAPLLAHPWGPPFGSSRTPLIPVAPARYCCPLLVPDARANVLLHATWPTMQWTEKIQ